MISSYPSSRPSPVKTVYVCHGSYGQTSLITPRLVFVSLLRCVVCRVCLPQTRRSRGGRNSRYRFLYGYTRRTLGWKVALDQTHNKKNDHFVLRSSLVRTQPPSFDYQDSSRPCPSVSGLSLSFGLDTPWCSNRERVSELTWSNVGIFYS